jgi:hypothetical protein
MAFFPCIYFCENNRLYFTGKHQNLAKLTHEEIEDVIIKRADDRHYFYMMLLKMFHVGTKKGVRIILENPWSTQHYLYENFPYQANIIDRDRTRRGDFFRKPTQYIYLNCQPTYGKSYTKPEKKKIVAKSARGIEAGICSEERSLISPDYARNFICDFIIGKVQAGISEPLLFDIN